MSERWTRELPTEGGRLWWYWHEDLGSAVELYLKGEDYFWAFSIGESRPDAVDALAGGWWLPCLEPEAPRVMPEPPIPPVDRTQTTLTDGSPVTKDHREIGPDGQQKGYVVLSAEERAKGFVRPVRHSYEHETCGTITTMGLALAETYARDPSFYGGTMCVRCGGHFPVGSEGEFVWEGTNEKVGT